jgi:uncharacterized membrane protein HdeD (DUF308 family)
MTTPHSTSSGQPGQSGQPEETDQRWASAGPASPPRAGQAYRPDELSGFGPAFASAAWPAFMAAGLGCLVVGVILLVWPKATLTIVAVLIGIALIVAGVLRLMDGFTSHDASGGKRVASVLVGLLAIILGLYCIRHYHLAITALAIIVGLFWVIHGVADIAAGLFARHFPGRGFTLLSGVLSTAVGLIVLFWPTISLTVLVAVIGIWLIVYGILTAVLAFRLRREGSRETEPQHFAAA